MSFNIDYIRSQFPALALKVGEFPAIFFDGPGGTQMPQRVIDCICNYIVTSNANSGGNFLISQRNDEMLKQTRGAFADFFNCDADEVSFCHNSTTICFKLSQALARDLKPGDEIIVTDIDHEANRSPWTMLAERGIIVHSVRLSPETCTLDVDHYETLLSQKTKVVAFNYASNAVGTINDAKRIIELAKQVGAITVVDAVHYALHGVIDVRALEVDFLFCSAYKFFGPHLGILFGRREAMEKLNSIRVEPQSPNPPYKFETGTLNHEGIAGAAEAVEFIADIGSENSGENCSRREQIIAGMTAIEDYENPLASYFKDQLCRIQGITLYGPPGDYPCTSTIAFRMEGILPSEVESRLGEKGIFTWSGNFYAVKVAESLGLESTGGLVRIGLAPYNTREEIDRTLVYVDALAANRFAAGSK